jgi:hypothetical protein
MILVISCSPFTFDEWGSWKAGWSREQGIARIGFDL